MSDTYTSHLCTFMGRRNNLQILLVYIEQALKTNAIDNYWMIDMTRCVEDHEFIYTEQQRLNDLFPGRVHIYNREERSKILQDKEAIADSIGQWGTFYKFLTRFKNNDVIAKCDDDTFYIDVDTLKAAFDLRWKHKTPYLMHANCINNGITAYHQHEAGVWSTEETGVYPTTGLTGPLFSDPKIACEHHKQFCTDLKSDLNNVDKYKLGKNIFFTNRISINFIFMLGTDRDSLSQINLQDEYETSSKIPQRLDRPNVVIGDFTVAHHTYGVQEPVMEKEKTYDHYLEVSKLYHEHECDHKSINMGLNLSSTIKDKNGHYVGMTPVNENTYVIKHVESGKFIGCRGVKEEKWKPGPNREKIGTGVYMLMNQLFPVDDINDASLFDLKLDAPTLLEFNNSNKLLRTGGSRQEKVNNWKPGGPQFPAHMIAKFFQGGYKTEFAIIEPSGDHYKIKSKSHPNFNLTSNVNLKANVIVNRWSSKIECEYDIIPVGETARDINLVAIHRCDKDITNDSTCSTLIDTGRRVYKPREFYWMVDHFIWEFVPVKKDIYKIKLIADDYPDLYMGIRNEKLFAGEKDDWKIKKDTIQHVKTGKFVSTTSTGVTLSDKPSELFFNINES